MMNRFQISSKYTSPVEFILKDLKQDVEDEIIKCVLNYDIKVDKTELMKALNYDRNQYALGFNDGYQNAIDRIRESIGEVNSQILDALDALEDIWEYKE